MKTLIDKVLSLESEAERILEDAHAEAKKADQEGDAQIAHFRAEAAAAVERRIEEYRREAEQRHLDAVAAAQASLARDIERVKNIPDAVLAEQAAKIVTRFCEL